MKTPPPILSYSGAGGKSSKPCSLLPSAVWSFGFPDPEDSSPDSGFFFGVCFIPSAKSSVGSMRAASKSISLFYDCLKGTLNGLGSEENGILNCFGSGPVFCLLYGPPSYSFGRANDVVWPLDLNSVISISSSLVKFALSFSNRLSFWFSLSLTSRMGTKLCVKFFILSATVVAISCMLFYI